MPERGSHVLGIPTATGGKVVLPYLTEEQAAAVVASFADVAAAGRAPGGGQAGRTRECIRCGGAGHRLERRRSATGGGGAVVVSLAVPCGVCRGTGRIPVRR
ncbi:hypothetical protein ACFOWE_25980 [Planomonospora corallina]|uniref:Uncharacterized protein n=1 Tax=Planomonospora corallina TaxID=1806052 RepID=A0ABV8IF51_9ACTN